MLEESQPVEDSTKVFLQYTPCNTHILNQYNTNIFKNQNKMKFNIDIVLVMPLNYVKKHCLLKIVIIEYL